MKPGKLKFLLLVIVQFIFLHHADGQVTFEKTFGGNGWEKGNNIQVLNNAGYIICGSTSSFGSGDPYILRINLQGDTIWTKVLGVTDADRCKVVALESKYLIQGSTTDFGSGGADAFLIELDTNCNINWTKSYGGINDDFAWIVEGTNNNGYVLTGRTQSYGPGLSAAYIVRVDSAGDTLWSRAYGGSDIDDGSQTIQSSDGGFIVVGKTASFGTIGLYTIKIDSNGNVIWSKVYTNYSSGKGLRVQELTNGGYIIIGQAANVQGTSAIYVIQIDNIGNIIWSKTYSSDDYCSIIAWSIDQTANGDYIIGGQSCGFGAILQVAYLLRLDSTGSVLWCKRYSYGGNMENIFYDVKQTTDGGFIAVGETGNLSTKDLYLVKTDADGNSCSDSMVTVIDTVAMTVVTTPITLVESGCIVDTVNILAGNTNTVESLACLDTITGVPSEYATKSSIVRLILMPNPFNDYATIEAYIPDETTSGQIRIIDLLGVTHKLIQVNNGYNDITLLKGDLPSSGIYFCILEANNEIIDKIKFISLR